jgi:hypothetical protein
MELPKVRHINKDKRKKRKHHYKEYDPVVIKFYGERHICFVEKLEFTKDKLPTYRVRSVTNPGCIYYELELDDPDDPYCYVSSTLTKSLTDAELKKIKTHADEHRSRFERKLPKKVQSQPNVTANLRVDEKQQLKKQIQKQKSFVNGEKFW